MTEGIERRVHKKDCLNYINNRGYARDSTKVNINAGGVAENTHDAIVIGSGISGGWAAKELCDHG